MLQLQLGDLDGPTWDSVTHALQRRLTDSVIDVAAHRLPPPYYPLEGARLARALRMRRDRLPDVARDFYRMLAQDAEVYGEEQRRIWHEVMTPEMIRQLPAGHALVIRGSHTPVIARLSAAWKDPAYRRARRRGVAVARLTPAAPEPAASRGARKRPGWAAAPRVCRTGGPQALRASGK